MVSSSTPSTPMLETLPLEIVQTILASLDDISSLISAALTGPFLFNALRNAEGSIATEVLTHHLSPALVHDAIIAQKSFSYREEARSHDQVIELIERYIDGLREPSPPPLRWNVSDALPLARFHKKIQYLSDGLISTALSKHPVSGKPEPSHAPPSKREICRIERALYRLEIYSNLFWNRISYTIEEGNEQQLAFFSTFSPWENEQLACIRDYIVKALRPVYKETAMNDPIWLAYFLHQPLNLFFLEHHLHHGISHIFHLLTSSKSKICPPPSPSTDFFTASDCIKFNHFQNCLEPWMTRISTHLNSDLEEAYVDRNIHERWDLPKTLLAVFNDADEAKFIPRSVTPDPDLGPEEAWRWAHDLEPAMYFVAGYGQASLREWGYVFWDMEKLERWDIFGKYWEGVEYADAVEANAREEREFKEEVAKKAMKEGIEMREVRGLC